MASIITLDGARGVGATDEYGQEIPDTFSWGDAAQTFVGWSIVAFAAGTAIFRVKNAIGRHLPSRGTMGRARRRRR